jgi:formylglycine-generating enzyme required for sulfatase activity
MSDIFISYANKDRYRASRLVEALRSEGWSVFWDQDIPPGRPWGRFLGAELAQAHCVLVAWSKASLESGWVAYEEAEDARKRDILVPVFFDDVQPPFGFRHIQAANLVDWKGRTDAPEYQRLVDAIERLVPRPETHKPIETPPQRGPRVFRDTLADGSKGPEMVRVPAGEFEMGDLHGDGHADERLVHTVSIHALAIGHYAVTFEAYDRFAEATGREKPDDTGWGRGRRPVINVSWRDAVAYAEWLSRQTGKRYRLPTEAEWEYAARAGTRTSYWWGDEVAENRANFRGSGSQWDGRQTAPVGSFEPNPFGLYDASGNVWEWVQDCWRENYDGAPTDGAAWLQQDDGDCNDWRVIRGGAWGGEAWGVRSASRDWYAPDARSDLVGFRLARDID